VVGNQGVGAKFERAGCWHCFNCTIGIEEDDPSLLKTVSTALLTIFSWNEYNQVMASRYTYNPAKPKMACSPG